MATFISIPPWRYRCSLSPARNTLGECFEDRTRTLPEGVKSLGAFGSGQRIAAVVEHGDAASADQKSPFATDAVVNSGPSMKQRTVAQRPDNKFVTKAPVAMHRVGATSPKVHGRKQSAFLDPDEEAAQSKANKLPAYLSASKSCCKTKCEIAF